MKNILTNKAIRFAYQLRLLSLIATLLFTGVTSAFAQIQHQGTPASFASPISKRASEQMVSAKAVDITAELKKDEQNNVKNRFGVYEELNLDIKTDGVHTSNEEYNIWTLRVSAENAKGIMSLFKTFDIPPGAKMYIYNPDQSIIQGAYTADNNLDGGIFMVGQLASSSITIEYNEPLNASFEGGVILDGIGKSYRSAESKAFPRRIGINCPDGDDWQVVKRAIARMEFKVGFGTYYCSGALINNTNNDETPYFLTANHCISTEEEAESTVFYFNYENSTCDAEDASLSQSISGATLKANSAYTDFSLLLIDNNIPSAYEPYFAAWDATGDGSTHSTSIHHPQATPKCVSIDEDPIVSHDEVIEWDGGLSYTDANTHWASTYETGSDEGGSSGCPVFNQDQEIIGQLHGGSDVVSYWGKFDLSWDHNTAANEQLAVWLDPNNVGVEKLEGLDLYADDFANFTLPDGTIYAKEPIDLQPDDYALSDEVLWTISPSNYSFINGTNEESVKADVEFLEAGTYTITCTVTRNGRTQSTSQQIVISEEIEALMIFPNPSTGSFTMNLPVYTEEFADVYIYSTEGRTVFTSTDTPIINRNQIKFNTNVLKQGSYVVNVVVAGSKYSSKLMIIN